MWQTFGNYVLDGETGVSTFESLTGDELSEKLRSFMVAHGVTTEVDE